MYICTYVCVSIHECVCVCVCVVYICVCAYLYVHMHAGVVYVYIRICACLHTAGTHTIPQVQYLNVKYNI